MSPDSVDSLETLNPPELIGLVRRLIGEVERLRKKNEKLTAALASAKRETQELKDVPANDRQRNAVEVTRQMIWWFYRQLKAFKLAPSPERAAELRARFDRIFKRRTGYATLDRLLKRLHANKDELLRVLDRPEIPLNTNASENDIRVCVTKRKISGGTVSERGRSARDVMLGLAKTCAKLKISFFDYLGARLQIPGPEIPPLPRLIAPVPS